MKYDYDRLMEKTFSASMTPADSLNQTILLEMKEENEMSKEMKKNKWIRNIGAAVAGLALCLVASNGIVYAATGYTWTSKIVVWINGEAVESEATWHEDEEGNYTLDLDMDSSEADSVSVASSFEVDENVNVVPSDISGDELNEMMGEVVEEDGRKYFKYDGGRVDITDDLADDGEAEGDVVSTDGSIHYIVIESDGGYDVSVSSNREQ